MKSYFHNFDFISDEVLKRNLVLDFKDVLTCMKRKVYKGAVVFAGGIVEAVLIDRALNLSSEQQEKIQAKYFDLIPDKEKKIKNEKIERMDLYYLIKSLETLQIITSPQASRCDVLRDYRNLIHPFKTGNRPTKKDALSVKKLLDDLIYEFNKNVKQKHDSTDKYELFLQHPKWKIKREKIEYIQILELFVKKLGELTFKDLLNLPSFGSKKNPSKSLISHLNYLKEYSLCTYKPDSWRKNYYDRYEEWMMNSVVQNEVKKYLRLQNKL